MKLYELALSDVPIKEEILLAQLFLQIEPNIVKVLFQKIIALTEYGKQRNTRRSSEVFGINRSDYIMEKDEEIKKKYKYKQQK